MRTFKFLKNLPMIALFLFVVLALASPLIAQTAGKYYRTESRNTRYTGDLYIGAEVGRAFSAVSLTSPTVTFSVDGMNLITLNSDANQTAAYPTGGELGQVITIVTGSGSNTIRFDDGAKTNVGSNLTVTEGQGDVVTFLCTDAAGDVWVKINGSDN